MAVVNVQEWGTEAGSVDGPVETNVPTGISANSEPPISYNFAVTWAPDIK
jgi:hypothetical protein